MAGQPRHDDQPLRLRWRQRSASLLLVAGTPSFAHPGVDQTDLVVTVSWRLAYRRRPPFNLRPPDLLTSPGSPPPATSKRPRRFGLHPAGRMAHFLHRGLPERSRCSTHSPPTSPSGPPSWTTLTTSGGGVGHAVKVIRWLGLDHHVGTCPRSGAREEPKSSPAASSMASAVDDSDR